MDRARLVDRLRSAAAALAHIAVAILIAAAVLTAIDVSTRRSLGSGIPGMVDITQMLIMACVFLAMPYTFFVEGHVGVETFTDWLPPRALSSLKAILAMAKLGFVAALAWYSGVQALLQIDNGDKSQTIGIPILLFWLPLLVGLALSAGVCALLILRHGHDAVRSTPPAT